MDLTRIPRAPLAQLPTPLEEMSALGRELGGVRLFIKRDDCTGLAFGGNKTRKLEFALADAQRQGADAVVTSGGLQSNHVRQTAAACARLGLACHAVVSNPLAESDPAYSTSGNLLLDRVLGATVHVAEQDETLETRIEALCEELRAAGGLPYVVPIGASNGLGSLGYALCARELMRQCTERDVNPSHVFLATGSCGTHAGLLAGLKLEASPTQVVGVAISGTVKDKRARIKSLVGDMVAQLEKPPIALEEDDVCVLDGQIGPGYGIPTPQAQVALMRLARAEGILLDPVYTAKAMAGMLDALQTGALGELHDPIFLHTGGAPALFAYPELFQGA